jgi:hypothetical protein
MVEKRYIDSEMVVRLMVLVIFVLRVGEIMQGRGFVEGGRKYVD